MPAQRLGAAEQQLGENTLDLESEVAWPGQKSGGKLPDQVDHARRRLRLARGSRPEVRRWVCGGASAGGGAASAAAAGCVTVGELFSSGCDSRAAAPVWGVFLSGIRSAHCGHCRTGSQSRGLGERSKC
jgi:hypothetical protein